eukprot:Phypoly_transcript_06431.p1 GENE.Phypoly_transcript_06431~~Phypoly_transcript_06431.p1  ORF type:complete len:553 (+),score=83.64 Phypoly_transcript_06431:119-1777(+)
MRIASKKVYSQLALHAPYLSKGTSFAQAERDALHLRGLLPPTIETIDQQVQRCMVQYKSFHSNLKKYTYLASLKERNETLFYKVVVDNIEEMMPIIYTPTVGEACEKFGKEYRIPQGMYFTSLDKGEMNSMVDNWPHDNVTIIVVSDGSRILGLGDLGSNGMGIPVGKLGLYVAGGGFHPDSTLPVILDVGTDNKDLLNDPLYLGIKQKRLRGKEYDELMDEFLTAVKRRWPKVLVQFEDFSHDHCFDLLSRYRDKMLCFNDDIQGTGAVVLAGLINASKAMDKKLSEHKFVVVGAGSAAVGCADAITTYLKEKENVSEEEGKKLFWFTDSDGLVTTQRKDLPPFKEKYARDDCKENIKELKEVLEKVKPTCLIGLCGQKGVFDETVVKKMAEFSERPIIFALSNPTANSECTAEEAFKWTKGKCIFASGSPFDPVEYDGKKHKIPQANNVYIFPGLGLGASLCQAEKVTTLMVNASATALAELVSDKDIKQGVLYPELSQIRNVSAHVATRVIECAQKENVAKGKVPKEIERFVKESQYVPSYSQLVSEAK